MPPVSCNHFFVIFIPPLVEFSFLNIILFCLGFVYHLLQKLFLLLGFMRPNLQYIREWLKKHASEGKNRISSDGHDKPFCTKAITVIDNFKTVLSDTDNR